MPNLFRKIKLILLLMLIVVMILGVSHTSSTSAQDLLFVGDFEKGDLTGFYWQGNAPTVTTSVARAGNYAMKSFLDKYSSPHTYRTEVLVNRDSNSPPGTHDARFFTKGEEYWVGFSIYLPPDWSDNYLSQFDHGILFQFHSVDYVNPEEWREILPLIIYHQDGVWNICNQTYADSEGDRGNLISFSKKIPYEKGKWTDWVMHVKFSGNISPNDTNGFIQVWKDGELVVDITGQNYFGEQDWGPYIEFGIYQWGWKDEYDVSSGTTRRTVYHDELRIAGADASYEDVAPGGSPPSILPTPTPTLIPSIPGDLDKDGDVDIFDLVIVGNSFGKTPGDLGYDQRADANGSGETIDIFDLIMVGSHFGNIT